MMTSNTFFFKFCSVMGKSEDGTFLSVWAAVTNHQGLTGLNKQLLVFCDPEVQDQAPTSKEFYCGWLTFQCILNIVKGG